MSPRVLECVLRNLGRTIVVFGKAALIIMRGDGEVDGGSSAKSKFRAQLPSRVSGFPHCRCLGSPLIGPARSAVAPPYPLGLTELTAHSWPLETGDNKHISTVNPPAISRS